MKLMQLNIENLTALWTLGGKAAGSFMSNEDYAMSIVPSSAWPNKLWFHTRPNRSLLNKTLEKQELKHITIPVWGPELQETEAMLLSSGFEMKSELTGMSLSLGMDFRPSKTLCIRQVDHKQTASKWSQLFQQAFGYLIHPDTVEKTMHTVKYFIGHFEGQSVGTAVLYLDEHGVAGIHSMGILPDQRRKGFAEALLVHLLNLARQEGATYATLQASAMGKGVYQRTGFKDDFQLKNFVKP